MKTLRRLYRRFLDRRRTRRVARDLDRILWMLETYPELRKHVRKTLRVSGYEG